MRVLVDKLNTSQQRAPAAKASQQHPGLREAEGCEERRGGSFPSAQHQAGTTGALGPVLGPCYRREMDILEQIQQAKMIKGLEHLPYERLRELGLISCEQRRLRRLLPEVHKYLIGAVKKAETLLSGAQCTGQEAIGKN